MTDHDGELSDPDAKRASDKANAKARQILFADLMELCERPAFLRWFGKYAIPTLLQDIRTTNGGDLQHFMGRRGLILEIVQEVGHVSPGFMQQLLAERESYENSLRQAAQKKEM